MKTRFSFVLILLLLGDIRLHSQTLNTQDSQTSCRLIYDENQHLIIPKKGLVVLYFYNSRHQDSMSMKSIVEKLPWKNFSPSCFQVDISLSFGLKRTYQINSLPAITVLQDKKVIYGLTGFSDDANILTEYLEKGIRNRLIISQ